MNTSQDTMAAKSAPTQGPDLKGQCAPSITIKNMGVSIGRYDILKDVNATVPSCKQTVIIGPNGAGKSTLVLSLLGELPHVGEIIFTPPGPRLGFVPQRLDFDRHLPLTVAEFMALGRSLWPLWLKVPKRLREENLSYLELVKATHLADKPLGSLSGGETQRVFLARALMNRPDILILDEPATGVDVFGEQLLCEILESFKKDFTIVMVSHDLATAKAHGDWIICLNRTVIAEGPPADIFRSDVLAHAFGLHQSILFGAESGVEEEPCPCCHEVHGAMP
ncbi:MAG: metal ABC transporter ATP-binding protein [Deltaproteobacteria bacterium]|jgi:zinc transport system ATP-binding protein|nr:metal ABC transporter ATP-binding protein [Deltaproteobacteria bacterium]